MITLVHLRALLERALTHTENPAIVRVVDRTVEGLARAYLPRTIWRSWDTDDSGDYPTLHDVDNAGPDRMGEEWASRRTLDLTDPGTAHALLVALALALGLDPGVGGLACAWFKRTLGGYILLSDSTNWTFERAEPDPLKALTLAVRHVLEHP